MIIGAMKCGTSSLFNYLTAHPEICPAREKEPEFFSENQGHGKAIAKYSDLWRFNLKVHKYALEASTGYTKFPLEPNVAKNIFEFGIRPKFIYIVRNPFVRIESHFNYMNGKKNWNASITDDHLINVSNYFLQISPYLNFFPVDDILIIDFDLLNSDPASLLDQIYDFLGIEGGHYPRDFSIYNRTQTGQEGDRPSLKRRIMNLIRPIGRRHQATVPLREPRRLTVQERELIHSRLLGDMLSLRDRFGIDVSKWGF